jgi:hypothetical protein
LEDLSDVTIDPVTGQLLLLSDRSRRVALMRIERKSLTMSESHDLPLNKSEKPEGLDFASNSRLLIVTDDSAKLLEMSVQRR